MPAITESATEHEALGHGLWPPNSTRLQAGKCQLYGVMTSQDLLSGMAGVGVVLQRTPKGTICWRAGGYLTGW